MPTIRLATEADADPIRAIYAPFCEAHAHVSFEYETPSVEEIRGRIARTLVRHPWLVWDDGGAIRGYVYAGPHGERAAYAWSVNVSVYIEEGARRSGIGRRLYLSLFAALRVQGFVNAFAGATLPNPASIGLHERLGFEPIGTYRGVGYKAGTWWDTRWMELALRDRPDPPDPPLTLAEAMTRPGWAEAIGAGILA